MFILKVLKGDYAFDTEGWQGIEIAADFGIFPDGRAGPASLSSCEAPHTANFAIRPTHLLNVVQAIIVCLELAGYVYQLHGLRFFRR